MSSLSKIIPAASYKPTVAYIIIVILSIFSVFFYTNQHILAQDQERKEAKVIRPVEEIVKDIESIEFPVFDESRTDDSNYIKEFRQRYMQAGLRTCILINELYINHPDDPKTQELMPRRWELLYNGKRYKAVENETKEVLEKYPNTELAIVAQHWIDFYEIKALFDQRGIESSVLLTKATAFIKKYPKDERGTKFLYLAARTLDDRSKDQIAIYRWLAANYPETPTGQSSLGKLKQIDDIGKQFALEFTDALTQQKINIKDYRGKVVIVHYWASWWPATLQLEFDLRSLYEKYHDQGLVVLGISLDLSEKQDGLQKLIKFVKENDLPWPQYYQGDAWSSEFSRSWGIDAIPWNFVIDSKGILISTNANDDLENIIRKLYGMEPLPVEKSESDSAIDNPTTDNPKTDK